MGIYPNQSGFSHFLKWLCKSPNGVYKTKGLMLLLQMGSVMGFLMLFLEV